MISRYANLILSTLICSVVLVTHESDRKPRPEVLPEPDMKRFTSKDQRFMRKIWATSMTSWGSAKEKTPPDRLFGN